MLLPRARVCVRVITNRAETADQIGERLAFRRLRARVGVGKGRRGKDAVRESEKRGHHGRQREADNQ